MQLPKLPVPIVQFIPYLKQRLDVPVSSLVEPFKAYENKLREVFAQEPDHPVIKDPHVNVLPVFSGSERDFKIRARNLNEESKAQQEKYLFPLQPGVRKSTGESAIVHSLNDFRRNFNLFSESSLADLKWDNVVAAGSSVVTALLPVPGKWGQSKRTQREFYHDYLAPASDVDLFLYGLNEEQAVAKIKQIETCVRDSILSETTTIRTKNAITICSQYPTRHIQIVLRLYKSVSEILTGFDVDCSCVAYDGSQVYASPRAAAAFITQTNTIDLTRRSPSYENRLSKYSHRGFEVFWEGLDRSRIDPTVFERSFARVVGLARLLVLEKLPTPTDRDGYLASRRNERGRPPKNDPYRYRRHLPGNKKDQQPDDVAEWVEEDDVSSYHTFTIPYGPKYHAKKIEKLLYTKDLLLNAEWNRSKEREVDLHRHPCFFGRVEDVIKDCCGYCPKPTNEEDEEIAEEESKIYVSGEIQFMSDDPGRQAIGSFHPLTDDDWTEMAYVGNTFSLCQAIVDGDLDAVKSWCEKEGNDVNRRDYTGRTPLHLATLCSTPEIVQYLVDHGARMIWRLVDGFTALHIAAWRGNVAMVKILLEKSEANEEEEFGKEERRKAAKKAAKTNSSEKRSEISGENCDDEGMTDDSGSEDSHPMTEGSFVKVKDDKSRHDEPLDNDDDEEPDVFNVNILAWDSPVSPLHCAILRGHVEVIETLVESFGADVLLPVKIVDRYGKPNNSAIMNLVMALQLDKERRKSITRTLLKLGANPSQADNNHHTALLYVVNSGDVDVLDILFELNEPATRTALNYLSTSPLWGLWSSRSAYNPLLTAIYNNDNAMVDKLLDFGAEPEISFETFMRSSLNTSPRFRTKHPEENMKTFRSTIKQPIVAAAQTDQPDLVYKLIMKGANANDMTPQSYQTIQNPQYSGNGCTVLDIIRGRLHELREYKGEPEKGPRPAGLENIHYPSGLEEGTYQEWMAKCDFELAKDVHDQVTKEFESNINEREEEGRKIKMEEIQAMIKAYEEAEKMLLRHGARTFLELNPDSKTEQVTASANRPHYGGDGNEPFKIGPVFLIGDPNERMADGYLQLFQAAWEGNTPKLKHLTLGKWGDGNSPLNIAVQDSRGFSPWSIAVYRGHFSVARTIVDIAAAQYHPKDESSKREKFYLRPSYYSDDDSIDSDDDDDNVHVFRELVDDTFTIDDIGAIGTAVKSHVTPLEMISWQAPYWRCVDLPGKEAKDNLRIKPYVFYQPPYYPGSRGGSWSAFKQLYLHKVSTERCSFLRYAIYKGDKRLLKFLIDTKIDLTRRDHEGDDIETSKLSIVEFRDFKYAMTLDRIDILQHIIQRTGHGIPIKRLIEKSGIEIVAKPNYYQGLSVYGSKRKDWAQAGRGGRYVPPGERENPLHGATFEGSLSVLEWYLNDGPARKYKDFVRTNGDNVYMRQLAEGGIDRAIGGWLGAREHLTLHGAVLSVFDREEDDSLKRIGMVLDRFPNALDRKSMDGYTALHLAIRHRRLPAARYLISVGANQTLRDNKSRNLLHVILCEQTNCSTVTELKEMLELVDKRLVKSMFLERCSVEPTSLTPLMLWLHEGFSSRDKDGHVELAAMLDTILEYSGNEVLDLMDGAGDYPLHVLVKKGYHTLIPVILARNPAHLFRENAVGMTPLELCNNQFLRHYIHRNPSSIGVWNGSVRSSLETLAPTSFLKEQNPCIEMCDHEKTREICLKAAAKYEGAGLKRKLVSLFDANAVAKRLAARKARKVGLDFAVDKEQKGRKSEGGRVINEDEAEDDDDGVDEVRVWIGRGEINRANIYT